MICPQSTPRSSPHTSLRYYFYLPPPPTPGTRVLEQIPHPGTRRVDFVPGVAGGGGGGDGNSKNWMMHNLISTLNIVVTLEYTCQGLVFPDSKHTAKQHRKHQHGNMGTTFSACKCRNVQVVFLRHSSSACTCMRSRDGEAVRALPWCSTNVSKFHLQTCCQMWPVEFVVGIFPCINYT